MNRRTRTLALVAVLALAASPALAGCSTAAEQQHPSDSGGLASSSVSQLADRTAAATEALGGRPRLVISTGTVELRAHDVAAARAAGPRGRHALPRRGRPAAVRERRARRAVPHPPRRTDPQRLVHSGRQRPRARRHPGLLGHPRRGRHHPGDRHPGRPARPAAQHRAGRDAAGPGPDHPRHRGDRGPALPAPGPARARWSGARRTSPTRPRCPRSRVSSTARPPRRDHRRAAASWAACAPAGTASPRSPSCSRPRPAPCCPSRLLLLVLLVPAWPLVRRLRRRRPPTARAPGRGPWRSAQDLTGCGCARHQPPRRPDRCRQHLRRHAERDARGAREVRRPHRQACLRRLDDPAAGALEGRAAPARDPADPAVRLHHRQELHRLGADHRRDGPALLRQPRRLRDRVQRQRLHPARHPAAGVRQDGLRPRPTAHPGIAGGRLRPVHLPRGAGHRGRQSGRPRPPERRRTRPAAAAACPTCADPVAAIDSTSHDDGWTTLSAVGSHISANDPSFDSRNYGYPKLVELARAQDYVDVEQVGGRPVRLRRPPAKKSPPRRGAEAARAAEGRHEAKKAPRRRRHITADAADLLRATRFRAGRPARTRSAA